MINFDSCIDKAMKELQILNIEVYVYNYIDGWFAYTFDKDILNQAISNSINERPAPYGAYEASVPYDVYSDDENEDETVQNIVNLIRIRFQAKH